MADVDLVETICRHLVQGTLDPAAALPALKEALGEAPDSTAHLLSALGNRPGPAAQALKSLVRAQLRTEAFRAHQAKTTRLPLPPKTQAALEGLPWQIPVGWRTGPRRLQDVRVALSLLGDMAFLRSRGPAAGRMLSILDKKYRDVRTALDGMDPSPWFEALAPSADGPLAGLRAEIGRRESEAAALARWAEAFHKTAEGAEKQRILDTLCAWPTSAAAPLLRSFAKEAWVRERVELTLVLRFGGAHLVDWSAWNTWLLTQEMEDQASGQALAVLAETRGPALLYLWLDGGGAPPAEMERLWREVLKGLPPVGQEAFAERWMSSLLPTELESLAGAAPSAPPPAAVPTAPAVPAAPPAVRPAPVRPPAPLAPAPAEIPLMESVPKGPSLWADHLLPFFTDNWPMVTGVLMVLVGSSLLAYYTWDKHWLLRYTLMPSLLGAFTVGLARLGHWLEKRDEQFQGTAHLLRGAAIGLLPANVMTVTLLARDPNVPFPAFVAAGASLVYLAVFGAGLRSWCRAAHASLGGLLGGTLLAVNAVALTAPLARGWAPSVDPLLLVTAAFYGAFLLCTLAVRRFALAVLTPALAKDEKVPWFFGVTLVGSFIEVFLWVHGSLGQFPRVSLYAPLVSGAGGLILFVERRALALRETPGAYRAESFLGFAFLLMGAFMAMNDPGLRPAALTLAGGLWLTQTLSRREPLHHWIGLTLVMLGGASAGLWEFFPRAWWPGLGIALALVAGGFGRLAPELSRPAGRMQGTVLAISTVVAGLVQWHEASPPALTAAFLAVNAVLLLRRGLKDDDLTAVHTGLGVAALALPYVGCVDMAGRTLRGNTLAFGLGLLSFAWLGLVQVSGKPVLRAARSTGLWLYGILATTAVAVRVLLEQGRPAEALASQFALDYGGPALMTAALLVAAYLSRSLVPSMLAAVMTAVLLPEMKMIIHQRLPWISFGSGLATSLWSLLLVWTAFPLRNADFLKDLDDGDLFNGTTPFFFRRRDHTLFTLPLAAVAIFLAAKVDVWNLSQNLLGAGIGLKTSAALLVTGAAWTGLAVYLRRRNDAVLFTHLGWMAAAAGITFGYWELAPAPVWHEPVMICGVLFQTLFWVYRLLPGGWARGLLAEPMRLVLMGGGVFFSILSAAGLIWGNALPPLGPLLVFTAVQLVWHGLSTRSPFFGTLLFFQGLTAALVWRAPGAGPLLLRLSVEQSLTPLILYFIGAGAAHLVLEPAPAVEERLRPVLAPFLALAAAGVLMLGIGGLVDAQMGGTFSARHQGLLMGVLLLFGRAQASGPFVLMACLLGHALIQYPELRLLRGAARLDLLLSPWRLGAFSFALSLAGAAGRVFAARWPRAAGGPHAQEPFKSPTLPLVWGASLTAGFLAPMLHLGDPTLRALPVQMAAPYFSAAAYAVIGCFWGGSFLFPMAAAFLTLGNIHAVRHWAGPWLRARGLTESHLAGLGAAASLVQFGSFRARPLLRRMELVLAGFILTLLAGIYFVQPNLGLITSTRFIVSGLMAYGAGLYFLRAARRPDAGEQPFTAFSEGVYHYAVTTSFWCAAMLVPWLRRPEAAFIAFALPVLYFYVRAEAAGPHAARYRNTAAFLSFMMWGLYFFRAAFQMVMFPDAPVGLEHYHFNAPWAMVLGLIMLRLQGLGGTPWLGFYGGLAVMGGSYFTLTRWPGLSPAGFPVPSAWCAVALGHFWILVTAQRSPVRAALQRLGALEDMAWASLRRSWGLCLLAAVQGAALWGLADYRADTFQAAPLLAGAATVALHLAWVRRSTACGVLGAAQLLLALHMDFLIPSFLPAEMVVWVLILLWSLALFLPLSGDALGALSVGMAGAVMGHVMYHHPSSSTGLWAVAAGALAASLTPRPSAAPASGRESFAAGLLWLTPVWLTYFHQAPFLTMGPGAAFHSGAVLSALAALFLTGAAARLFQRKSGESFLAVPRPAPRLFHQAFAWAALRGQAFFKGALVSVAVAAGLAQASHYGRPYPTPELRLLLGLYGASAAAWFRMARREQSAAGTLCLQFCVLAFFGAVRRQLMLTTEFWNYEYDVWASLAVSALLAGFKTTFDLQSPGVRYPMIGALLSMPVLALIWAWVHHMGTHVVLLIVGLHSVLFTHMGKDDRESPYNVVAVVGFVSFVMIVFWTKLQFRTVHAYVIPVGLGVLVLLHLLRERLSAGVANTVRLFTLLAMLGSAGYYALLDPRFPLVFHMTLILLGLLAMTFGGWFKVRVYLFMGFTGVAVDLASILYRVLVGMDRGSRMTVIGGQVLALGAALVFGAVYYKTHQEEISAALDRWRERLRAWE